MTRSIPTRSTSACARISAKKRSSSSACCAHRPSASGGWCAHSTLCPGTRRVSSTQRSLLLEQPCHRLAKLLQLLIEVAACVTQREVQAQSRVLPERQIAVQRLREQPRRFLAAQLHRPSHP